MDKPFNRIKIVLAEKRLRSKELAEKLNVTESTVSRWCSNESQPKPEMFLEIAQVLNIDVRELIERTTRYEVKIFNSDTNELIDPDFTSLPTEGQAVDIGITQEGKGYLKKRRIIGTVADIREYNTGDEYHIKADVYLKVIEDRKF